VLTIALSHFIVHQGTLRFLKPSQKRRQKLAKTIFPSSITKSSKYIKWRGWQLRAAKPTYANVENTNMLGGLKEIWLQKTKRVYCVCSFVAFFFSITAKSVIRIKGIRRAITDGNSGVISGGSE
jgi:hypothetical protein